MRTAALLSVMLALPALAGAQALEGATAAFFGVSFLDTSTEGAYSGPRADEAARVEMVEAQLADALRAHGLELVPLGPVAGKLGLYANPADCSGCEVRMAAELGADYSVTSEVQKVSNLILAMNVVIRDAASGEQVRAYAADIRSNTDESWTRGMRYILENGIFPE